MFECLLLGVLVSIPLPYFKAILASLRHVLFTLPPYFKAILASPRAQSGKAVVIYFVVAPLQLVSWNYSVGVDDAVLASVSIHICWDRAGCFSA